MIANMNGAIKLLHSHLKKICNLATNVQQEVKLAVSKCICSPAYF